MMYLLAIFLPPVAVLLCGKPFQFVLNCLLSLMFVIPGSIHACLVVSSHQADKRQERMLREMAKIQAAAQGMRDR